MKQFVPFHEINSFQKVLGVDCFHPKAFPLSHWKGAETLLKIQDDTSAAICLNAIKENIPELNIPYVSSNHFDIDGFVGVWALLNPILALKHEEVLRQMALIGDFRELNTTSNSSDWALKLVCWINAEEKKQFYAPFESHQTEEQEGIACVEKFKYFLEVFEQVLLNPEKFSPIWKEEYDQVQQGLIALKKGKIADFKRERIRVVELNEPIHYYALFSDSSDVDIIISCYEGQRYEMEYKYTTWVDCFNRLQFPRVHLQPLCDRLNTLENSGLEWIAEKVTDTGPVLRLNQETLSRYERFMPPNQRKIGSSSIDPKTWIDVVTSFFKESYQNLEKKKTFSWEETRKINNLGYNLN